MPRQKKQKLKIRKDGRFVCFYKGKAFYGYSDDEALKARETYKQQEAAGEYSRESPTVREYGEKWLPVAKHGTRQNTLAQNKIHLAHLYSVIGDEYIKDVKPSDLKRVYSTAYKSASKSYISHAKALFSRMFGAAFDDGLIRSNPVKADAARPHEGKSGSHRAITAEERHIIESVALGLPASRVARVMLYSGLRPQEIKALNVNDVDFENGWIHVRHFIHKASSNAYDVDETGKTKKAARDVPLFPPAAEALKGVKGYIISNHGEIVTPSVWANEWRTYKNAIERHLNGVQKRWYGKTKEHKELLISGSTLPQWREWTVVPYDLRHSFVTWCRDNGVELNTCIEWMGHKDASMILRIYDDPTNRSKKEAEKLIKTLFSRSEERSDKKQQDKTPVESTENEPTPTAS